MREIKFRQAIKSQSAVGVTLPFHWHHWGYLGHGFDGLTLPLGRMEGDDRPSYQYTGLKDKNGIEIYEGDILVADNDYVDEGNLYLEVKWNDKQTGYYLEDAKHGIDCDVDEFEMIDQCYQVIGNIYETPELLNV
jgi:hypothetical protein